jgi:putative SOS response-associated peptidase YedK
MCGRATLTVVDYPTLAEALHVEAKPEHAALYKPRWNLAPTNLHWIVRHGDSGTRELEPAHWGLVNFWAKDLKRQAQQINARVEDIEKKPAYREAYKKRHCLVPVDGFYEWVGPAKKRMPIWFHRADDGVMLLAGLWEDWKNKDTGDRRRTFTILTRDAKGINANYHDRMPVIVPPAYQETWLTTAEGAEPPAWPDFIEKELLATEVDPRVNSVKNDDPSVLQPPFKDTLF